MACTLSHTDLLATYVDLRGDLIALAEHFSLSGLQLLALLEDPAFTSRMKVVDDFLARSMVRKLQNAAADALNRAIKEATNPAEARRAGNMLARLSWHWGQPPVPPRTPRPGPPRASAHDLDIPQTQPAAPPSAAPVPTSSPRPITIADVPSRADLASLPGPLPSLTPITPSNIVDVKVSPHLALLAKAGQAHARRASSA